MAYIKVPFEEVIELQRRLDLVCPSWQYANDDHLTKRAYDAMRALEHSLNCGKPFEGFNGSMWILIPDRREAMLSRLMINFDEFGPAVWDENRKVDYRWQCPCPGYVIG